MKKTVNVIIIMTILAMVMGIVNISNAFSFNASLSSDDKLVAGQEVKVTLSLSGINMDDGIRSIKVGKITVGEEFESVSSADFDSTTWVPTYLNGGLVLMSGTPVISDGVAVTLTLKVRSGITAKSSTIKFEDIVASSGSNTGDISVGTKTIIVKANEQTTGGNGEGTTNSSTTNNIQDGITNSSTTNNVQDGTNQITDKNTNSATNKIVSSNNIPTQLPKAGNIKSMGNIGNIVILLLILIAIVVGIATFIKYKKVK